MNKHCVKLKQPLIVFAKIGECVVERVNDLTGFKYNLPCVIVEVDGRSPSLNGWRLVAAVEQLRSGENFIRCVPGAKIPDMYRTTGQHCDHCHTNRRRKEVFILRHDDGRHVQVGRQCIADFLGHTSIEGLIGRAEMEISLSQELSHAEDGNCSECGGEYMVALQDYIGTVAICIRRLGWVSRRAAEEHDFTPPATATVAWQIHTNRSTSTCKMVLDEGLLAENRDIELSAKALAWARELPTDKSEYLYNLGATCRNDIVTGRTAGIVASLFAAYEKTLATEQTSSKHVGTIGKREKFAVKVVALKYFESPYGVKTLCRFDAGGNTLVWWASKPQDWLKVGDEVEIVGAVSKHSEYNGNLQTELKRVKRT